MKTLLKIFVSILVIISVWFLILPPNGETSGVSQGGVARLERRLPDAIILGVMKCGTITLGTILGMHPSIATPGWMEIKFFSFSWLYQKGVEYYRGLMPLARPDQVVLVKSPFVFQSLNISITLQRHVDTLPDVKVILVVKNPIDRVVSDILHNYLNGLHKGEVMPDINDIIMDRAGYIQAYKDSDISLHKSILMMSNYSMMYQQITNVFPLQNILIVNGQTLVEDPLSEIKKVEQFLSLPAFFNKDHFVYPEEKNGFPCFNLGEDAHCMDERKGRPHPPLAEETRHFLQQLFQPMLDQFEMQTGIIFTL